MSNLSLASEHKLLLSSSKKLLPSWSLGNANLIAAETQSNPTHYLDSFYLYQIREISVNSDCQDIPKFITERFHSLLAAANQSNLSIALLLSRKKGKTQVYLGLKKENSALVDPEIFEAMINGILPGKKITLNQTESISNLANGFEHGGIITGIPSLKKDDEKSVFNLASVSRSLYGKDFLLAVISSPVQEEKKLDIYHQLIKTRDELHLIAKNTISEEQGFSQSSSYSQSRGESDSYGAGLFFIAGANYNKSHTVTDSNTETSTNNASQSWSKEQQNGYAIELEKISDHYIERIIQGLNAGYWETTITFATPDKATSEILAGTFVAELSKPSDKLLPPSRVHYASLENKVLLIPNFENQSSLFPSKLSSYITSEELAFISSVPTESITGYEIQRMPVLSLTDNHTGDGENVVMGSIADHGNPVNDSKLNLALNDLNKHLFVCGLTGSGKTTTVKHLLKSIAERTQTPFLVLESAKRDYRQLLGNEIFKDNLNIFTIGDATVSPIRFNPFYIQKGVNPLAHIDFLKAIFNASFSLYGPMPSIVEKCLHAIYIKKGWDLTQGVHPKFLDFNGHFNELFYEQQEHYYCFPTLNDLKKEVHQYIETELDYQGELRDNIRTAIIVRLESLCVGAKGLMFNTHDFYPIDKLLSENVIFEMESLADDDDKAFFVGLVLVLISEYRQKENPAVNPGMRKNDLEHFLVIEEAHRLLKNIDTERSSEMMGNPKGKAVEVFCNILSEMRSLGQGVCVVEQIPSKISPDVIKNSNTKIVHRLVAKDDQALLAGSLGIDENDALYLNRLQTGFALCHKEGMARPVECAIESTVQSRAVSDDKIQRLMKNTFTAPLHHYISYQIEEKLGKKGLEIAVSFFNSLVCISPSQLEALINKAITSIKMQLSIQNCYLTIDDTQVMDYLALSVMLLLNKGNYSNNMALPNDFKTMLTQLLAKPNANAFDKFITSLAQYWNVASPIEFLQDVVINQCIHYCRSNKQHAEKHTLDDIVFSYFLVKPDNVIDKISQKLAEGVQADVI